MPHHLASMHLPKAIFVGERGGGEEAIVDSSFSNPSVANAQGDRHRAPSNPHARLRRATRLQPQMSPAPGRSAAELAPARVCRLLVVVAAVVLARPAYRLDR